MKYALIISCFIITLAFASSEKDNSGDKNIYVHTLGDFNGEKLKQEGVIVKRGISSTSYTADLPTPWEMKNLLVKAGLKNITNWDQFDLDVLSVRLKTKPFGYIVRKYPDLDKKKLQKYKELLTEPNP